MKKYNYKIDRKKEKEKGITLVALVITVVVMLILAGVAIAAVVDGDGLFSKTRDSAQAYENAAEKEADDLQKWMNEIDNYLDEISIDDNLIYTENKTYDGQIIGTYDNPIIPKGFKPVENKDDSTITKEASWKSETGYQHGLVIEDNIGNQFVWIPVDGEEISFSRQTWYNEDGTEALGTKSEDCEEDISLIENSVNKNGGFYIARYEAGKEEGDRIVSKQGSIIWNYYNWEQSKLKAESMYENSNINYGATSTLIYGIQWDTALKFIGAYGGDADYIIDSTGKGNYFGVSGGDDIDSYYNSEEDQTGPAIAGARDSFMQKNIYDMGGNVWEWTMETVKANGYKVYRGGGFARIGGPASYRANYFSHIEERK